MLSFKHHLASFQCILQMSRHDGEFICLSFNLPDGQLCCFQVWDLQAGTCVQTVEHAHAHAVMKLLLWGEVSCQVWGLQADLRMSVVHSKAVALWMLVAQHVCLTEACFQNHRITSFLPA